MKLLNALGANSLSVNQAIEMKYANFKQMYSFRNNSTSWNGSELIERLGNEWQDALSSENVDLTVSDLFVDTKRLRILDHEKRNERKPKDADELLNTPLENLVSGGAICQMTLNGLHDEFRPSLAINITEKGEQIGFGLQVAICKNFTIFGADNLVSTWEKVKVQNMSKAVYFDIDMVISFFKEKLKKTYRTFQENLQVVERLKHEIVAKPAFEMFLGREFQKIEKANHYRILRRIAELPAEAKDLIMNSKQFADFSVEAAEDKVWNDDVTNKWLLLNASTEILKLRHGSDIMSVLNTNVKFTEYLLNYDFAIKPIYIHAGQLQDKKNLCLLEN